MIEQLICCKEMQDKSVIQPDQPKWVRLRRDSGGDFAKVGFPAKYCFHSKDIWAGDRLKRNDYEELLQRQKAIPVVVMESGNKTWWMFRGEFYWEDRGYTPEKVKSFVVGPLEVALHPEAFSEFVGQEQIKKNLAVMIEASQHRGEPLDHILLWGAKGVGKSTLAHVIAFELGRPLRVISGRAIKQEGDLAAILSNLNQHQILFVEEIGSLKHSFAEMLCLAMREFMLDFVIGKGATARVIRLKLPRFTVLATAVDKRKVPERLVSAFGASYNLIPYTPHELQPLVMRAAEILHTAVDEASAFEIAQGSSGLPQDALRLLKRVRDFADVRAKGVITKQVAEEVLSMLVAPEPTLAFSQQQDLEGRESIPDWMRRAVLDRDKGICRYCGRRAMTLHLDHIIPVTHRGRSTVANLATACADCNRKKGGRTPEEAGMTLLPPATLRE